MDDFHMFSGLACRCVNIYLYLCFLIYGEPLHQILFMHKHGCYKSKLLENSGAETTIPFMNHLSSKKSEDGSEGFIVDNNMPNLDPKEELGQIDCNMAEYVRGTAWRLRLQSTRRWALNHRSIIPLYMLQRCATS